MRWQIFLFLLSVLINQSAFSQMKINLSPNFQKPIETELKPFYTPSEGQFEDLLKGEVISVGNVTSPTSKEQQLMLFVAGMHPRTCTRALRKLSLYENYSQYMDFIKSSKYDEKTQKFSFSINHALLPFPMEVGFKIPRITKPGDYPFVFEDGFLKGLQGTIVAREVGKHCLLGLKSDWRGPESKIPDFAFGTFVQTVGKLGMEHLIRISIY